MHSDSYFRVGSTHDVCQDYALAGRDAEGRAYAIVSDGCSGSPDTDFGSRFLAKSMQFALGTSGTPHFRVESALYTTMAMSQQMASSCNMKDECLDATLLCAVESVDDSGRPGVQATMIGDGVIVARYRGQSYCDTHLLDFYDGFPAYLNYLGDLPRRQRYVKETDGGLASVSVSNGELDTILKSQHRFFGPGFEDFHPYTLFFDREKYDMVMLMSDGALSFQKEEVSDTNTSKRMGGVPVSSVIHEMTDFKSMKGEFVARRAKKFLTKTCADNRWAHYDDFSVAVVAMD